MRIKKFREGMGITQKDLATKLGVDQSTISLWESGKTAPRASLLPQIAKICKCTIDELLMEEHDEQTASI